MSPRHKNFLILRQTPANRFTWPILLSALERGNEDREFTFVSDESLQRSLSRMGGRSPFLVAYSFMTPHIAGVWKEIRGLRKRFGNRAVLVAGGPHAQGDPEGTLRMGFDAVSTGEGEITFPDVCRSFLEDPTGLGGRVFRSTHPIDLDLSMPLSRNLPLVPPIELTRGCHYRCRFCQTSLVPARHRSMESIKTIFDELARRNYLFRTGFLCPSGFEYGSDKPGKVCPETIEELLILTRSRGFKHVEYGIFPSEVRPETVRPEFLRLIRKYCSNKKLTIGAQSGSDRILKRLARGHTIEDTERTVAWCRESGLRPILDVVFGFPDETEEDQISTLSWIHRLHSRFQIRAQVHAFLPLSGTPLAERTTTPLSPKTIALLEKFYQGGISTNWWKKGWKASRSIQRMKERLAEEGSSRSSESPFRRTG
jgi:B12-binding domain/radical SAM domain protein